MTIHAVTENLTVLISANWRETRMLNQDLGMHARVLLIECIFMPVSTQGSLLFFTSDIAFVMRRNKKTQGVAVRLCTRRLKVKKWLS